jgi:predicted nucleic acid-binding Zn ribbon protein
VIDRHLERLEAFLVHAERARESREKELPTYEYNCPGCPMTITIVRSLEAEEFKPICANCAKTMTRNYDAPPIHLKGEGWGKD